MKAIGWMAFSGLSFCLLYCYIVTYTPLSVFDYLSTSVGYSLHFSIIVDLDIQYKGF